MSILLRKLINVNARIEPSVNVRHDKGVKIKSCQCVYTGRHITCKEYKRVNGESYQKQIEWKIPA